MFTLWYVEKPRVLRRHSGGDSRTHAEHNVFKLRLCGQYDKNLREDASSLRHSSYIPHQKVFPVFVRYGARQINNCQRWDNRLYCWISRLVTLLLNCYQAIRQIRGPEYQLALETIIRQFVTRGNNKTGTSYLYCYCCCCLISSTPC